MNKSNSQKKKVISYRVLGIFAHPDDESFGPSGTLIKLRVEGHDIHTITATRGQAGQTSNKKIHLSLANQRTEELKAALKIMGLNRPIILDFFDGTLNEHQIPLLMKLLLKRIKQLEPDIIIVYERGGISYHLDHIAVTKAVLLLFDAKKIKPKKIYYYGMSRDAGKAFGLETDLDERLLAKIDVTDFWKTKLKAMQAHISQEKDVKRISGNLEQQMADNQGKLFEQFSLARTTIPRSKLKFPETDLTAGL